MIIPNINTDINTLCSKMMDGVLNGVYCFTNKSGYVILPYTKEKL